MITMLWEIKKKLAHTESLNASRLHATGPRPAAPTATTPRTLQTVSVLPGTTKEWNELQSEASAASTLDTFLSRAF